LAQQCSTTEGCYRPGASIAGPDCSCPWIDGGNNSRCIEGGCPAPTPTLVPTPTSVPTPTIMPTPTPIEKKEKVILLPGLGGSWNYDALVRNKKVNDGDWELMLTMFDDFNKLAQIFIDRGFVKGEDLFIWPYDWRQPISTIVGKFGDFVNQKVAGDERVTIVGHSLGGLTARIWAQDNYLDTRIDKIVTLGSPHEGAVKSYLTWRYGKVSDKNDVGSAILKTFIKLKQSRERKSDVAAVRVFSPVVKDLLPTFEFLKSNNNVLPLTNKSYIRNTYLENKNQSWNLISDKLYTITGDNHDTLEYISLSGSGYEYTTNGDGTVLQISASLNNYSENLAKIYNTNHMQLIKNSTETVSSIMDGDFYVPTSGIEYIAQKPQLVFFLGSPAYLSVQCDNGPVWTSNSQGFIIEDDNGYNVCNVEVIGTGRGYYELVMGRSDTDSDWKYYKGSIRENQKRVYKFYPGVIGQTKILQDQKKVVKSRTVTVGGSTTNNSSVINSNPYKVTEVYQVRY